MIYCDNCGEPFDPIASRWLCPFCHFKANCCEGEPYPTEAEIDEAVEGITGGKPVPETEDIEDIDLLGSHRREEARS